MYRILFILGALFGFARDYLSDETQFITFIYSLLIVEASAEIINKTFVLRMLNKAPKTNLYFDRNVALVLLLLGCFVAFIIAFIIGSTVHNDLVSSVLLYAAPLNVIYRYTNQIILNNKEYSSYYGLDSIKSCIVFVGFLLTSEIVVFTAYFIVMFVSSIYFWRKSNILVVNKLQNKLYLVCRRYIKDFSVQLQSLLVLTSILLDKLLIFEQGKPVLLFLLVGKFVLFSVSLFNNLVLQVWHVENRGRRYELTFTRIFRSNFKWVVGLVLIYYVFFQFFLRALPVGNLIEFDYSIILLGGIWLSSNLIRDIAIRLLYLRSQYNIVGKILSISSGVYIIIIISIKDLAASEMLLGLILINLLVTFYFIIESTSGNTYDLSTKKK